MGATFAGLSVVHAVDLAIGVMALEAMALALHRLRSGRAPRSGDVAWTLASGFCLLLALRAALTDAGWIGVLLPLTAGGIAHGFDLRRRWSRAGEQPPAPRGAPPVGASAERVACESNAPRRSARP